MGLDMVKTISFGDDAGHLMERLLKHAGIGEVEPFAVRVQPEGDGAAMELLREAAEGGWIVRTTELGGELTEIKLDEVSSVGVHGVQVAEDGSITNVECSRRWSRIERLHIY